MNFRTVFSATVCYLGMCLVSNGAEPTLEDILKAWEEREKATLSLQMAWKEKAFIPKRAINQCYGYKGKTNLAGVDVPDPFPATDKYYESTGTLAISKNDLICEFNSPRFAFLQEAMILHENYRVLLTESSCKMLDINSNSPNSFPSGFEASRAEINEPNNNLIRLVTLLLRSKDGKDWEFWNSTKKTLIGERQNPNGGNALLLIESDSIQTQKISILVEKSYPFLPKLISVASTLDGKISWDMRLSYQTDNVTPKSYICNVYHKGFLKISYDVEITNWETSQQPLEQTIFKIDYPVRTLINKRQPDGKTKLYGIAQDGSEHEIDISKTLHKPAHELLEEQAKSARRSRYIIIAVSIVILILIGVFLAQRSRRKT